MEVTSYVYVFAPDTSQLRGKHRLRPGGLATVIRQVLAPQSWGWFLRPTRLVPALRRPSSHFCTSTWMPLKKSLNILSLPLADFIAPADCSSWELRLRQPTASGRNRRRRGARRTSTSPLPLHVPPFSSPSYLGDTGASGPGF